MIIFGWPRYCAVCHPYTYRDLTQTSSVSKRVSLYIIPVLVFSVVLNIPKFFETRIVYSKGSHCYNLTIFDSTVYLDIDFSLAKNFSSLLELLKAQEDKISFEMTELRDNPDYIRFNITRYDCEV